MVRDTDHIDLDLIERVQTGDKEAQTLLLEYVEPNVRTYIFRMTMDNHIRDDLSQETLMELVRSLPSLTFQHTNLFWAWLYRTALSKVQRHYRIQGEKRLNVKFLRDKVQQLHRDGQHMSGAGLLMHKELCQAVIHAMSALQLRYRSILTLRCFDELSYPEIASVMGMSEAQARLCFFRAKLLLKRHLHRTGFKKNYLLSALGVFATLTASESQKASAATALSAGSLHSPWTTVLWGTLTSKTILSVFGLLLTTALLVNLVVPGPSAPNETIPNPVVREIVPVYDDSLSLIYDNPQSGYSTLTQVLRSNHPNNEDWKHFVFFPGLQPVRLLKSAIDDTPASLLVLGKDQWIEYGLPGNIQDHPDPEISIYIYNWGRMPGFFITDGRSRQMQIFASTYRGQYPLGPKALGFDLSQIDCPFVIRGIRIVGNDDLGPYGGCGIDPPKVFLEPIDAVFREQILLGNN